MDQINGRMMASQIVITAGGVQAIPHSTRRRWQC
jgi:hypothetical protein